MKHPHLRDKEKRMSESTTHMKASPPTLRLDIVVYEEDGQYVAHCVQLDLVHCSAESMDAVYDELREICCEHVLYAFENDKLDSLFRPANPALFLKMLRARNEGMINVCFDANIKDGPISSGIEFQYLVA
tara:strand:- start:18713 stop:19102 length:390 start_codon:yes stop_codon:yes gene_type:complete